MPYVNGQWVDDTFWYNTQMASNSATTYSIPATTFGSSYNYLPTVPKPSDQINGGTMSIWTPDGRKWDRISASQEAWRSNDGLKLTTEAIKMILDGEARILSVPDSIRGQGYSIAQVEYNSGMRIGIEQEIQPNALLKQGNMLKQEYPIDPDSPLAWLDEQVNEVCEYAFAA